MPYSRGPTMRSKRGSYKKAGVAKRAKQRVRSATAKSAKKYGRKRQGSVKVGY